MLFDIIIGDCGIAGAILVGRIAEEKNQKILIIDKGIILVDTALLIG